MSTPSPPAFRLVSRLLSALDRLPSASACQQFVTNNYHNLINMSSASVSQQFGGR